jgi:hypothetical protein
LHLHDKRNLDLRQKAQPPLTPGRALVLYLLPQGAIHFTR